MPRLPIAPPPRGRRRPRRELAALALLAVCTGCPEQSTYKLRLSTPWADEYTPPRRADAETPALLSPPVARWHAAMNVDRLVADARARFSGRSGVYGLTRRTLARRSEGPGASRIWVVEVRLGRRAFSAGPPPGAAPTLPRRATPMELAGAFGAALQATIQLDARVDADETLEVRDAADPRVALAQTLAVGGLFIREWPYLPLTLRSWEYPTPRAFLDAIAAVGDELQAATPRDRLTIVPLRDWQDAVRTEQRAMMARLTQKFSGRRRFGEVITAAALPTPTLLSDDPQVAARQAIVALAAQSSGSIAAP